MNTSHAHSRDETGGGGGGGGSARGVSAENAGESRARTVDDDVADAGARANGGVDNGARGVLGFDRPRSRSSARRSSTSEGSSSARRLSEDEDDDETYEDEEDEDDDDGTYEDDEEEEEEEESESPGLNVTYPMFLCDERHFAGAFFDEEGGDGASTSGTGGIEETSKWRTKDRMKTVSVALVLCLNIGVDPPDTMKISPCARMQCWINPMSMQPQKELDAIGKALQAQYERWQPRAKYKLQLDPTTEDMKKLCISCRRNAKNERVLLHYNGHGVPRPTANGEIWVFNKSYTQYIPLSVYDLQLWTGTPAIYVFDCSNAGLIIKSFLKLSDPGANAGVMPLPPQLGTVDLERRQSGGQRAFVELGHDMGIVPPLGDSGFGPSPTSNAANECILLAACGPNELLPQSAELPADVFSACLTTPVQMALHWFCSNSALKGHGISADIIDNIPGQQNNRKTPLGELNWIFTAITDTIAWNVLPRQLFQKLFRQDLLVASLFRNFLLAERIMRANNCTPVSSPKLPPTHQHPMWEAWDMAVEQCLLQMPMLLSGNPNVEFIPSPFFTDQLTAFEVWLEYGNENDAPPEQLPIVLQVLLSQSHRLRALVLLGRFLDLGLWAVELALSVGIFPYVLKLLQTTAPELRQILVFIWTKILALDHSCQADLVKDDGHVYFIRFLQSSNVPVEERAMAAFILAVISDGHEKGQTVCAASGLMDICLSNIIAASQRETGSPFFLRWLCLCLGKLWEDHSDSQIAAFEADAHTLLASVFKHSSPDARAAAVFALGSLINIGAKRQHSQFGLVTRQNSAQPEELMHVMSSSSVIGAQMGSRAHTPELSNKSLHQELPLPSSFEKIHGTERTVASHLITASEDASPLVRVEVAVALARVARAHSGLIKDATVAWKRDYDSVMAKRAIDAKHHKRSESVSTRRNRFGMGSMGGSAGASSFDHGSFGSTHSMMTVDEDDQNVFGRSLEEIARSSDERLQRTASAGSDQVGPQPIVGRSETSLSSIDHGGSPRSSFDAPRIGLYVQILQVLLNLALDSSPLVSAAAFKALSSTGLENSHPIMEKVLGTGNFKSDQKTTQDRHRRRSSFASVDLTADGSSGTDLPESPGGSLRRTDSWHQRLTTLGHRLLGSPTKKAPMSPSSLGSAGAPQSPQKSKASRDEPVTTLRRPHKMSSRVGTMLSPSPSSTQLPAMNIPHINTRTSDLTVSPHESPLRRTASTLAGDEDRGGFGSSGNLMRLNSHTSLDSLEMASPRPLSGEDFSEHRDGALPKSVVYKRGCSHFSTALLEPMQDDEDITFDAEDDAEDDVAPWLRHPDQKRRTERLTTVHERVMHTRSTGESALKMTEYVSSIDCGAGTIPTSIVMHPLESRVLTGDSKGQVHVWDSTNSRVLNKFHTELRGVSAISLVNETDDAMLLTGAPDGHVKIWRDYDAPNEHKLVTAWCALPTQSIHRDAMTSATPVGFYKPSTHYRTQQENAKAIIVWQQLTGCLYATGHVGPSPLLRVWDMTSELCRENMHMQSQGTCLTAEGALLMAGTADGAVLSYDLRSPARLLSAIQSHTQPVISILLQPGGISNLLITGCSDGKMKFCDLRNTSKPFLTTEVGVSKPAPSGTMRAPALTALVGHSCAGVIASGSSERAIKLWDMRGSNIATIQYTNSFLGQRIGAVTALAFHPNSTYLAAGSSAGQSTIYGSERRL